MNLTPDQERAVSIRGRDACVLAGAGSGKTRVLVERTARLVLDGELRIPEILAITFTEKAAREMKRRLAERFESESRASERSEVEWAYVSTIHGFCSRLIRENAMEAAVDPAFDVLDEVQAETIRREVVEDVSARWLASRPEDHEALVRLGLPDSGIVEEILGFYEGLRGAGIRPGEAPVPDPDPARLQARITGIVAEVEGVADLIPDLPGKSPDRAREALAALPPVRALLDGEPTFAEVREALDGLAGAIQLRVAAALKSVLRPVRDELVPAALAEAAEIPARPCLLALRDFLGEVDDRYRFRKDELGVLDFADLEERARTLLREHPEVREEVRSRFRQVLVDEYQDVNPVQAEIIGLVRADGNHFAVGDVKQSIYGFRHAEPSIFRRRADEAGEEGRILLRENFRSSPGLVEFANHCFSRLFSDDDLVRWADMVAAADYAPETAPEVEILRSSGATAEEAREEEARDLARRVRRLVDDGELRIRRAGSDRSGEAVRFGDIAFLFRALTDVKLYERALTDLDVPYYVVKGRGFYQARELVDLVRLLRTVVNPRDEISLAAALRSPFGGLTDDGLLALVLAARSREDALLADLLGAAGAPEGLSGGDLEAWRRFTALHGRLRDLAARATLREVIEAALEESGYGAAAWMLHGGRRRVANLRKSLELADSFEGRFDLPRFLDALKDFRAREIQETEAPTGGEEEDVVRLLTIHAAKGLEFPVVVLPDLARQPVRQVPALIRGERGIAARVAVRAGGTVLDTASYLAGKEERLRSEEAEGRRLLYVAVTRAEEKLILATAATGREADPGSFQGQLSSVLDLDGDDAPFGETGRRAVRIDEAGRKPPPPRISLASRNRDRLARGEPLTPPSGEARRRAAELAARAARPRPPRDDSAYENTVSELLRFSACRACWYEQFVLGVREGLVEPGEDREDDPPGGDELPATRIGEIVHQVLRLWTPGASVPDLVARRPELPPELAEDVGSMVEAFARSEVAAELAGLPAGAARQEVPFLVRWELPEGTPDLFFRGQLDLLYPRPDGSLRIVDYKTGRPHAAYGLQLAAYARALHGLGRGECEAALVHLAPGEDAKVVEVDVVGAARERVEKAAGEFSRWLAEGRGRPAEHARDCEGATS